MGISESIPIVDGGGRRKSSVGPGPNRSFGTSELIVLSYRKCRGSQDYHEIERSIWRKVSKYREVMDQLT